MTIVSVKHFAFIQASNRDIQLDYYQIWIGSRDTIGVLSEGVTFLNRWNVILTSLRKLKRNMRWMSLVALLIEALCCMYPPLRAIDLTASSLNKGRVSSKYGLHHTVQNGFIPLTFGMLEERFMNFRYIHHATFHNKNRVQILSTNQPTLKKMKYESHWSTGDQRDRGGHSWCPVICIFTIYVCVLFLLAEFPFEAICIRPCVWP